MLQRAINPAERWRGHPQPANTKKGRTQIMEAAFFFPDQHPATASY